MGFSDDALARPIIGIADTGSDYNACHASVPRLVEAVKRGVMLAGGLPMAFPHHLPPRVVLAPDEHVPPEPDGDGHRGDGAGPADGRGGPHRRLRQDDPRPAHGRRERGRARPRPSHRPDDDRTLPGRTARGLHRLPPFLGHVPGGGARRRRDRGRERPARPHRRDLHGDGDRKHHGVHDGGARHDAAGGRHHPRGACGPGTLRRALRKARGRESRRKTSARSGS